MKRKTLLIIAVLLAAISIVGIMIIPPLIRSRALYWDIEIGDEISFSVKVKGYRLSFNDTNATYSPPPFLSLNNTQIVVNVTFLPTIPLFVTAESFVNQVIQVNKVAGPSEPQYVTINETEYLEVNETESMLCSIISRCILPVGDWALLDELYSDITDAPYFDDYYSKIEPDYFVFGYRFFLLDAGNGWSCRVSLQTGVPFLLSSWASKFYTPGDWYDYSIDLSLIID